MSTGTILRGKRLMLSACVSVAALAVASPSLAADMNFTKAPIYDRGEFRAFVEGGAFLTGGDPVPYNGGFGAFIAAITGTSRRRHPGCQTLLGLGRRGRSGLSLRGIALARQSASPFNNGPCFGSPRKARKCIVFDVYR
jgi:hypothetical protein